MKTETQKKMRQNMIEECERICKLLNLKDTPVDTTPAAESRKIPSTLPPRLADNLY